MPKMESLINSRLAPSEVGLRRSVLKLTERFARNPDKRPGKDVAQRVFAIADNEMLLKYHYEEGRITAETREFVKPPPTGKYFARASPNAPYRVVG
jgi:hypothetical protein